MRGSRDLQLSEGALDEPTDELRTSINLQRFCGQVTKHPPDWERIQERFEAHPEFDPHREFSRTQWNQFMSEMHLDIMLRAVAREHTELGILTSRIRQDETCEGYRFYRTWSGNVVAEATDGKTFTNGRLIRHEYDNVIIVRTNEGERWPVVFEIKTGQWHNGGGHHERRRGRRIYRPGRAMPNCIKPGRYKRRLEPLERLFTSRVGLVYVIPRDTFEAHCGESAGSIYHNFVQEGGMVIPLYAGRDDFVAEVKKRVGSFGWKVKEETRATVTS